MNIKWSQLVWLLVGLLATLVVILFVIVVYFPGWDAKMHNDLDAQSAEKIAAREIIRWQKKRGKLLLDEYYTGKACLMSRFESSSLKTYTFEFREDGMKQGIAIDVSSSPSGVESAVAWLSRNEGDKPNWGHVVSNCGR